MNTTVVFSDLKQRLMHGGQRMTVSLARISLFRHSVYLSRTTEFGDTKLNANLAENLS